VSDIGARYEFRVWGESLTDLRQTLERRATPVRAVSRETYLVSHATDRCNAKIRAGLIDIKILLAESQGLEQWHPVIKAAFPLDRGFIASQIFPNLGIQTPQLPRPRYQTSEFLNEVMATQPGIAIVEVAKTRLQFDLVTCLAEFTVVIFNGLTRDTVAIESASPNEALRLIHEIGLDGAENLSYVRYIKRMLGLG
jgi:hypothetical protein